MAAAGAIIVVVELLRSVPGPTSASTGGTAAASPSPSSPTAVAGGNIPTPSSPGYPSPPFGAIVLAQEARAEALALAVVPGKPRTLVRVSLLSASGPGATGVAVSVGFGGRAPITLKACGAGCYQAEIDADTVSRSAIVLLAGVKYTFTLPSTTLPPDGTKIVARAAKVWRSLHTLVWHERLAGNLTDALHTVYRVVAPDELSYTIAGGSSAIIIGGTRWDRPSPNGQWVRQPQDPPLKQPQPFWVKALDARVLGSGHVQGHSVWLVSFFDPTSPAWFEAAIDKSSYRTLELNMTAAAHFMHHVYGPFNAPLRLQPPVSANP